MLLQQVLKHPKNHSLSLIQKNCSQFIKECTGLPLMKNLPEEYKSIQKIKARKRNFNNNFVETFNNTFGDNLCQRAIFTNGVKSFNPIFENDLEPFYIFPINGYRYLYSSEIQNSSEDYKLIFETTFQQLGSEKAKTVITDLFRFVYRQDNLNEAIEKGSEIIIYNIPFYYGVKVSQFENYSQLLSQISV